MKKLMYSVLFISICILILNKIEYIYTYKQYSTLSKSLYYKEKNIYDIIFMGNSMIFYGISPLHLYNYYGLSSYNLSLPGAQFDEIYSLTEEIIKYKKPKVIVLNYNPLLYDDSNNVFSKGNISSIKDFIIRYKIYLKNYNYIEAFKNSSILYLFHNRWKNIDKNDFGFNSYLRGYASSADVVEQTYIESNDKYQFINSHKNNFDKYILLLEKHNIKVVFVAMPTSDKSGEFSEIFIDSIKKYLNKRNVEFLDLSNTNIFDFKKDFQSSRHLNYFGGGKLMKYSNFIPHIMKEYNLQDHRNNTDYVKWTNDYKRLKHKIMNENIRKTDNLATWFTLVNSGNYSIMITSIGIVMHVLPQNLKNELSKLGLNKFITLNSNDNYAAVIYKSIKLYENLSSSSIEYKKRISNKYNLYVLSSLYKGSIKISGKESAINQFGLNIVVYDHIYNEIVDSIRLEPNKFDIIKRY